MLKLNPDHFLPKPDESPVSKTMNFDITVDLIMHRKAANDLI